MSSRPTPVPLFKPLDLVPESGVYRVHHLKHRASHEAILLRGGLFPECNKCGSAVHFESVAALPREEPRQSLAVLPAPMEHPAPVPKDKDEAA
jgi:hypothetical protein